PQLGEVAVGPQVEPGVIGHLAEGRDGGIRRRERPIIVLVAVEIDAGAHQRKVVFDGSAGADDPLCFLARLALLDPELTHHDRLVLEPGPAVEATEDVLEGAGVVTGPAGSLVVAVGAGPVDETGARIER